MPHLYRRRVQFADTDAAGVVHFAKLLCYAEEAEHDLLLELGIPVTGDGGWPRVQVSCDYLAAVCMGDTLDVAISVEKLGQTSVGWQFAMTKNGATLAKGGMKTVRVDASGNAVELPEKWRHLLQAVS